VSAHHNVDAGYIPDLSHQELTGDSLISWCSSAMSTLLCN
jgi:hypothetical protein